MSTDIPRYEALVEAFPTSEVPRFSLACAYMEANRYEDAEAAFAAAIDIKPDYLMAWVQRARVLVTLEREEAAAEVCRHAMGLAQAQGHRGPLEDCEAILEEIEGDL